MNPKQNINCPDSVNHSLHGLDYKPCLMGIFITIMETWKDVEGFEGHYKISDLANVESLKFNKEKTLIPYPDGRGYLNIDLFLNGKRKVIKLHLLVCDTFSKIPRNGRKLQVDHKNNIKTDCRFVNLQLLTQRKNITKSELLNDTSSKYTGVSFDKSRNKWKAQIGINNKHINLGRFNNELEASNAYQTKLKSIIDE